MGRFFALFSNMIKENHGIINEEIIIKIFSLCDDSNDVIDFEDLMLIGIHAHRNAREMDAVSIAAIQWIQKFPTQRRFGIVAAFFNGLWCERFDRQPLSPAGLIAYVSVAADGLLEEERANFMSSLERLRSQPLSHEMRILLESAIERYSC